MCSSDLFNGDGSKLGSTPLSDDVEILDVNGDGLATRLWPSRLAGIALDSGDVKYVRKNAAGEIDRLILNDVTGDIYSYGVLTSVSETDLSALGGSMFGVYQYDVGGVSYTYQMATGILNQTVGPVRIEGNLYAPGKISKLNSVKLASVDALTAVATDNTSFPVWSSVAVYALNGNDYRLSSLERVRTGYTLTGYYDKSISDGGCIRVIVAKEQ